MEEAPENTTVFPDDSRPLWKRGYLLKLNFITLSMVLFSSANGYDGSIMGGLLALPYWNQFMHHPSGAYLGWIPAIYWIGNFIGFPIAAWVANRYGRKIGIYLGFSFLLLGVVMQTAAQNEATFTYSRLFIGFASAWLGNAAPLLINEIAHPKKRSIANARFMVGWYFGGTLCSWVVFACRDIASDWCWRIPVLIQITLPVMALPGFVMAPESPRWLISVGRVEQATEILSTQHAGGNKNDPLVHEIQAAINEKKEACTNASYADMFKTPGNRHRLFISVTLGVFSQWAGNGIVSYYLPLILNSIGITSTTYQTLISSCLNVWNLLWDIAAATSVDKLGRRFLFLTSASIMLVSFIVITGLSTTFAQTESAVFGLVVIPFLFIIFTGYDIAMTPFLTAYPCEIWSFTQRSRGLTVTWCSSVVALFLNTFANAIALEAIQWRYYFV
ncbi:sugar transporter [Colletotrichum incanum]|uniref:Sugar transporter n=1 Tax=Colletotrichum incanum TaxID=1573173 RepID=A0A167AK46_COLIC|nr:sugar transporter [Colletotrichum incanum]